MPQEAEKALQAWLLRAPKALHPQLQQLWSFQTWGRDNQKKTRLFLICVNWEKYLNHQYERKRLTLRALGPFLHESLSVDNFQTHLL